MRSRSNVASMVGRPKFSFHTGFCCCRDRDTDTCTFQNCLDQVDDATFVDDDDFTETSKQHKLHQAAAAAEPAKAADPVS